MVGNCKNIRFYVTGRIAYNVYVILLSDSQYRICENIDGDEMGRPLLYPVKKVIGFDQEMLDAINKWRTKQKPIPSVSDAIRSLVECGLKVKAGR